jgi:hypothetical protein
VVGFLAAHLGSPTPSPAIFDKIGTAFVGELDDACRPAGVQKPRASASQNDRAEEARFDTERIHAPIVDHASPDAYTPGDGLFWLVDEWTGALHEIVYGKVNAPKACSAAARSVPAGIVATMLTG